jgi:hypothetical protein
MNKNKQNKGQQEFEESLAKESPELFLKLKMKEYEAESRSFPVYYGAPAKLLILIVIVDVTVAFMLSMVTKISHFDILGSLGIVVVIPWWLAFLDGIIFFGYGIYVIKKKKGEVDIGPMTTMLKTHEIKGEAASLAGLIYILLGIFLIGVVIIRFFIQGIF